MTERSLVLHELVQLRIGKSCLRSNEVNKEARKVALGLNALEIGHECVKFMALHRSKGRDTMLALILVHFNLYMKNKLIFQILL